MTVQYGEWCWAESPLVCVCRECVTGTHTGACPQRPEQDLECLPSWLSALLPWNKGLLLNREVADPAKCPVLQTLVPSPLCTPPSYAGWVLSTWHEPGHIWKERILIEKMSPLEWPGAAREGLFLINDWCVWSKPWTGDPRQCKKAGWANHGEQACGQSSSVVFASVSTSRSLPWVPVLTSFVGGVWPESVSWNKPFPPKVSFGHGVLA